MSLKTIRDSFHAQLLNYRNTGRLIKSDDFAIAYGNATAIEKGKIKNAIKCVDKLAIRKFIKDQLLKLTPFHQITLKQLREIGRNTRIPDYWKKDKVTLIKEIENVVAKLKEGGK